MVGIGRLINNYQLNKEIERYVKTLNKNVLDIQSERNIMRYNIFEGGGYQFSDGNTLQGYIFDPDGSKNGQEIIILEGKNGMGKNFIALSVLRKCVESMKVEGRIKIPRKGRYRIPILITFSFYKKFWKEYESKEFELQDLIVETLIEGENCNSSEREKLKQGVKEYLNWGRFVIYFEKECNEIGWGMLLKGRQVYKDYRRQTSFHNIILLAMEPEEREKTYQLINSEYRIFPLDILSQEEISRYIEKYSTTLARGLNQDLIRILQVPQRLRMFEVLTQEAKEKMESKEVKIENELQFYCFFVRTHIEQILVKKEISPTYRADKIYRSLQKYAYELCVEQRRGGPFNTGSTKLSCEELIKCGILNQKYEFQFPVCGYFLAAEYLYKQYSLDENFVIPNILYEPPQEKVLLYAGRMIDEEVIAARYWETIKQGDKCRMQLLAKMINSCDNFKGTYFHDSFCGYALDNLKRDFYDYSVMEAFEELKGDVIQYLKNKYSTLSETDIKASNNMKRRVVYYLGISRSGIVRNMIQDLMGEQTEQHLRYHVIRAMVENYGEDQITTELIRKRIQEIERYCFRCNDPIIKSDFDVLYQKVNKETKWLMGDSRTSNEEQLKQMLESDNYWQRAHAAGALGRKNAQRAQPRILEQIKREISQIYDQREDYRNCIKVISYSVESICEISDSCNEETKRQWRWDFVNVLDLDKALSHDLEDAYATIATGIEYLMEPDEGKLPFNLGDRFRNHTLDYKKVLINILQAVLKDEEDTEKREILLKKIKQLVGEGEKNMKKKVGDTVEILQVSDWHIEGENIDDAMVVRDICKYFHNVQLMLITGDLHQFGKDYDKTLNILNDFVAKLNIEKQDVILTPGNHDSEDTEEKSKTIEKIRNGIFDDKEIYDKEKDKLYATFSEYEKFLIKFYREEFVHLGGIHNAIHIWRDCLKILSINTALMTDEKSEQSKIIDLQEINKLEEDGKYPLLAIGHHDFYSLYLDHQTYLKRFFERFRVSAYLCGDQHKEHKEVIDLGSRNIPNLIAGKMLGDNKDKWSDRAIIWYKIDFKTRKVLVQTYKWDSGRFVPTWSFSERPQNPDDTPQMYKFDLIQ